MAKLLRAITTDGAVLATALDSTDMAARARAGTSKLGNRYRRDGTASDRGFDDGRGIEE